MTNEEIHMCLGKMTAKLDALHADHQGLQKEVAEMKGFWREDLKTIEASVTENTEHMKLTRAVLVIFKWLIGIGVAIFGAKLAGIWSAK